MWVRTIPYPGAVISTPALNRRSASRAVPDTPCHSARVVVASSRRGSHSGWARRTSSWWMKNSSVLVARSVGPKPASDQNGGRRSIPISSA